MGYTHYWTVEQVLDTETFAELVKVVRVVLDIAKSRGVKVGTSSGEAGSPLIEDDVIAFNGIGDDSHESFVIDKEADGFNFCKTACKPYDVVVVAVLVLFKHFFPAIELSSDGLVPELVEGAELASKALGIELSVIDGDEELEVIIKTNEVILADNSELLKYAISFLATHIEEASDELDVEIDKDKVKQLEACLYKQ